MKFPWSKKHTNVNQFETVLQRLVAAQYGSGFEVTPETCMRSPTVKAIVTAVSRRFAVTPIHVYKTTTTNGLESKEKLPKHPVAKLLKQPNDWQTSVDYRQDLASTLVRWGRFIAIKGQGDTGPIRKLWPVNPGSVTIKQEFEGLNGGLQFLHDNKPYPLRKVHYTRGAAKDFITGDSPVNDVSTAIAIEIACEQYGMTFFNNGAMPLLQFYFTEAFKGFKTSKDEEDFVKDFEKNFSGSKRNKAMLLPKGLDSKITPIENEKAQFLETRQFYQTVIAGAWGVPPHLVGNLVNAHYNNVEQQDSEFTLNVVMPYMVMDEAAMERDLLTDQDRNDGIIIRYNMDATLRASFEERQKGLEIQMRNGVINANQWREIEGKNPRDDGNEYYYSANLIKEGEERANTEPTE